MSSKLALRSAGETADALVSVSWCRFGSVEDRPLPVDADRAVLPIPVQPAEPGGLRDLIDRLAVDVNRRLHMVKISLQGTPEAGLGDVRVEFHGGAPVGGDLGGSGQGANLLAVGIEDARTHLRPGLGGGSVPQQRADVQAGGLRGDLRGREIDAGRGEVARVDVDGGRRDEGTLRYRPPQTL